MKPRLLDLMCGAGGATRGYQLAGFHVTGVDLVRSPNYCGDDFILADALEVSLGGFSAIHASPPCQRYIRSGNVDRDKHPDLLPATRERLKAVGVPWVIENVPGAPMRADLVLCGSMFDLPIRRHRWFECSWSVPPWTPSCNHSKPITGVYGHPHGTQGAAPGMLPGDLETWSTAMGIDWMSAAELANAIPPAYTQLVGLLLGAELEAFA